MAKQLPIEIFMPPNMLRAKAGRTSRADEFVAVVRAEAAVDALKIEVAVQLNADIDRLEETRARLETSPDQVAQTELLRTAQDLIDQATTFDFPAIVRLATSLMRLVENSAEDTGASLALIDAQISAIRAALNDGAGTVAQASARTS